MTDDRAARIRERAYQIWQTEGEPHGRDAEHWQQAEQEADADPSAEGANLTSASGAVETSDAASDGPAPVTRDQDFSRSVGSDDLEGTTARSRAPAKAAPPRGKR
ncbi:Protein of unknown function [Sphingomonas gellani]|uniref:DUF2934 domain-containing protein n=1 Tax=Sphingomonas gellani TaxID=1166340 RepID=A0A1H8C4Z0_9SPHN|nr:DUF2934 domain-containing protein [Sphingomonas gellani]SEM90145.1 Protein of unknown function [Sphingomonas gellani]